MNNDNNLEFCIAGVNCRAGYATDEVIYYLCCRGQENLRAMTKTTFDSSTESTGKDTFIKR